MRNALLFFFFLGFLLLDPPPNANAQPPDEPVPAEPAEGPEAPPTMNPNGAVDPQLEGDQRVRIIFQCNLNLDAGRFFTCDRLRDFYFDRYKELAVMSEDPRTANITLTIGDIKTSPDNAHQFKYWWYVNSAGAEGSSGDVIHSSPDFFDVRPGASPPPQDEFVLDLNAETQTTLRLKLAQAASKAIALNVETEVLKDKKLAAVYILRQNTDGSAPPDDWQSRLARSPYFFMLTTTGSGNNSGTGSNKVSAVRIEFKNEAAYVTDEYKFVGQSQFIHKRGSQPDGLGGRISGQASSFSYRTGAVYVFTPNISGAVISGGVRDIVSNIRIHNRVQFGLEYLLEPNVENAQTQDVAVRGGVDVVTIRLDGLPNTLNHTREDLIGFYTELYLFSVLLQDQDSRLAGSLNLGAELKPSHWSYSTFTLYGGLTYKVNRSVNLGLNFHFIYRNKSYTYPQTLVFKNAIYNSYIGGQPGQNSGISFSIQAPFGNSLRKANNRRHLN